MKDCIEVVFDYQDINYSECMDVQQKLKSILLPAGWRYTGIFNVFSPIEPDMGDEFYNKAVKAIESCKWLRKYSPRVNVWTVLNACRLNEIRIVNMTYPSPEKINKYRKYFKENHKLAHAIVVDENNYLRDGYTSYIIANEEGYIPNIIRVHSNQPIRKSVIGRHVQFDGEAFPFVSQKAYRWYCKLSEAVVPGDILLVNTALGKRLMKVERIDLAVGDEECHRDRCVNSVFSIGSIVKLDQKTG